VLIGFALGSGVIGAELSSMLVVIVTLSMLVTPLMFIVYNRIEQHLHPDNKREADKPDQPGRIVIAGIGRFGQIINRMLVAQGFHTVVVDKDATLLENIRRIGVKAYFGDATKPDLLNSIGLKQAHLLVVAIDNRSEAVHLVQYVRRHYPDLLILARAYDRLHLYSLRKAGANLVVRETFDSAINCAKAALTLLRVPEEVAAEQTRMFVQHETETIDQLFEVWDQNPEINSNKAYLAGIKQRNEELRKALAGDAEVSHKQQPPQEKESLLEKEAREEAREKARANRGIAG